MTTGFEDIYPHTNLQGTRIIATQHLLNSILPLLRKLQTDGCTSISINTKAYSYNAAVAEELRTRDIKVFTSSYDSHQPYDPQLEKASKAFMEETAPDERSIILDEGGLLLKDAPLGTKGIEQTASGIETIDQPRIPIVDVARSHAKRTYEYPYIVADAYRRINAYLKTHRLRPEKTLIIGNGHMGKECKRQWPQTTLIDKDDDLEAALSTHKLVIGCTGKTAIPYTIHEQIKSGTVLVSLSSSDREFDAVHFRRQKQRTTDTHKNYTIGGVHLINAGFPITFDGKQEDLPWKQIGLTRKLMYAGTCIVKNYEGPARFIEVPIETQKAIIASCRCSR